MPVKLKRPTDILPRYLPSRTSDIWMLSDLEVLFQPGSFNLNTNTIYFYFFIFFAI